MVLPPVHWKSAPVAGSRKLVKPLVAPIRTMYLLLAHVTRLPERLSLSRTVSGRVESVTSHESVRAVAVLESVTTPGMAAPAERWGWREVITLLSVVPFYWDVAH